ncbi:RimJ/RimL family protein N-acetyltransferase [Rhodovulum imhoffii]|uniref:RimJ/RimL family protein N-acetyltransferase n=1 Tax=Rhodovulum imhoffii TaxID=365340 RepID=A0A2T5BS77_9RHOB|nr:GNAT family N-acetyltransferase [Rhodovulum imhoffii]MBK5934722.1 GNAT family N-acetyltransferase [Rhodovulum imhoffii]PTN02146.1 RimJ/RimL family protein N-acetyltransferase [Rhodovulum imhoffii]
MTLHRALPIPTLRTARLTLRVPGPRDVTAMARFYASARSSFVGGPKDPEGAWRQLATEIGHWTLRGYGRWMVDLADTAQTCGIVGLWNPEGWPEPEIGWDLFDGFEGHGYATEAALATRDYAYGTLGWSTVISLVNPQNTASARVCARMGAVREGQVSRPHLGTLDVYRHPAPGGA